MNNNSNQKVISLTEAELKKLMLECVSQIVLVDNQLNEGFWDALKGAAQKVGGDMRQAGINAGKGVSNMAQGAVNKAKQVGNNIRQGVQQGVQNVKNYANDVKQAGINASNNADIQKTIETIQNMMERGLVNPRAASMVIGSLRKAVVNQ